MSTQDDGRIDGAQRCCQILMHMMLTHNYIDDVDMRLHHVEMSMMLTCHDVDRGQGRHETVLTQDNIDITQC